MNDLGLAAIRRDTFKAGAVYCADYLDDWQKRGLIDGEYRKEVEKNNDRILGRSK